MLKIADKTQTVVSSVPVLKPLMRGWLHLGMAPFMLLAGFALFAIAPTSSGRIACEIYIFSALCLFGNSALYHRGRWGERIATILRRIDHANIFVFIAGTYTPLAILLLEGRGRILLLSIVWGIASAGVVFKVFWLGAPRILGTALYLAMGWAAIFWLREFWQIGGPAIVILLCLGGLVYTFGALVYALKRPDPSPRYFGYHEIFHACTILAALTHLACIVLVVLR